MGGDAGTGRRLAYYTVANALHYPGAVALLNSLRLVGEEAPLFVVDCGLTKSQRDVLANHATLVPQHDGLHASCQKATGPLAHPAELMVVLDADMIVTRRLTPLFEDAAGGLIVVFEDHGAPDRFFAEWSSLGLGVPRPQPYANCGFLMFSADTAAEFLPLFVELEEQLDPADTHFGGGDISNPFYCADQEILNAMLCTRYEGRAKRLDRRLAPFPPFVGLEVTDLSRLSCAYPDGVAPYLLHHSFKKPWLVPMKPSPYSKLFTRAVTGPDVAIHLGRGDIPLRLSDNVLAPLLGPVQLEAHRRLRGKLGVRPRLEQFGRRALQQFGGSASQSRVS